MSKSEAVEILLADDDPVVRAGFAKKMRAHGWALTLAADGFEALQAVRNGEFEVLLLDLKMPYRNGADVLRILRTENSLRETRVFLLAEPGDSELVEQAMREGADGVFDKSQMGPRDVISELQVLCQSLGRSARAGKAAGENVPDDVAKLASRFRKGGTSSGQLAKADHGRGGHGGGAPHGHSTGSRGQLGTPRDHGAPPAASLAPAATPSNLGHGMIGGQGSRMPAPPTAYGTRRAEGPAPGVHGTHVGNQHGTQHAGQHAAQRGNHAGSYDGGYDPYGAPAPQAEMAPPMPQSPGHGGYTQHQAMPPTAEPLPNEPSFDTVLNKMVGEAGRLAAYMGLPHDFSCPVCRNTLILRLWPEPGQEATVVGHFFCPSCTRS